MTTDNNASIWLPTSKKEIDKLGWDYIDVILFSGDAYIDHPSMGIAVIGRTLEAAGYRVAIIPQPNWQDDLRDFKKLGKPRLFFGVSAGAMDSMVNHYTAARKRRSDDAYTPNGRHGARPDYPTIVYTKILRDIYPDVPIVAGGIEASLRRLSHYDYWADKLRKSILLECSADLLIYGMGEKAIVEIAKEIESGKKISELTDIPQTVVSLNKSCVPTEKDTKTDFVLNSWEECLQNKKKQAENFKYIETESNRWNGRTLWQVTGNKVVKVNHMYPPMTHNEIDASFDLPYTRTPHPRYNGKRIPAYEMIRHSITMHRGCFGGCAFCTISAHQGKFIASRSEESILKEAKKVIAMSDFKGYISDLGGPSANMYQMHGHNLEMCKVCKRPSCLHPQPCKNLDNDHQHLLSIYHKVDALPGVKKSFIGSGVRYDLAMAKHKDDKVNETNKKYINELIRNHVSGRLKVAPEHTSDKVLNCMRKPSFQQFYTFKRIFDDINEKYNLRQQIIPYFISSHPACEEEDMAELAVLTKNLNFHLEQVQDFTPTPMTVASEIYYTGYHPYTLEKVYTAHTPNEKQNQRKFFFWYKPEFRQDIQRSLIRMNRYDLIKDLFENSNFHRREENTHPKSEFTNNRKENKPKRFDNSHKRSDNRYKKAENSHKNYKNNKK